METKPFGNVENGQIYHWEQGNKLLGTLTVGLQIEKNVGHGISAFSHKF